MIKAHPSPIWKKILGVYFEIKVRNAFFKTYIKGLENTGFLKNNRDIPVIFYCSHTSWWDAAIAIVLSLRIFTMDAYGMMVETQLSKYRFFTKIGMFSVNRKNTREALQSLSYAASLLINTNRALWIFPQGKIEHPEKRPIDFENGLSIILKKIGKAYVIPVAMRFEFLKEEHAEAFISIGTAHLFNGNEDNIREISNDLSKKLMNEIEELRTTVIEGKIEQFYILFKGRKSVEKRWSAFKNRLTNKKENSF